MSDDPCPVCEQSPCVIAGEGFTADEIKAVFEQNVDSATCMMWNSGMLERLHRYASLRRAESEKGADADGSVRRRG